MSATWDRSTGRVTFEDGRFIVLTGQDAEKFEWEWKLADDTCGKELLLTYLIRGRHVIHYPPKR